VTPEEIADLEDEWSQTANEAAALGQIGFLPYPLDGFRYLLQMVRPFLPPAHSFLDLGAGIGTKVLIAAQLGYQAMGVEVVPAYLTKAREIGANVAYGDVRSTSVRGFGIVYLNHPLAVADEQADLEARIRAELSPGAALICVNSPSPKPCGAHWRTIATTSDQTGYAVQKQGE
jgi:SAM-dependent methyltransferase